MKRKYPEIRWLLRHVTFAVFFVVIAAGSLSFCGCAGMSGYSNEWLVPEDVGSVYVEMFDNRTFWRSIEYDLTDALAKRIEVETPYKIITNRDKAETIISGQITSVRQAILTADRDSGQALEMELEVRAVVNWKNLKTGELLIDSRSVGASASYSQFQEQDFSYAASVAANNLARKIVELMEREW